MINRCNINSSYNNKIYISNPIKLFFFFYYLIIMEIPFWVILSAILNNVLLVIIFVISGNFWSILEYISIKIISNNINYDIGLKPLKKNNKSE